MDSKKSTAILGLALGLMGFLALSGCPEPLAIETHGWDHIDDEGTSVRIWGRLKLTENMEDWTEGFVWDTESHPVQNWLNYENREVADNYDLFNTFSRNIGGLDRLTKYYYRAFGEYLGAGNIVSVGLEGTFIPGGPRVTTYVASNVGQTSADLNGELWHMGGAATTNVFFQYGTDRANLDEATEQQPLTETGTYSATVTDLDSCTTYYFRAAAENDADTNVGLIFEVTPGRPIVWTRLPNPVGADSATFNGDLEHLGGAATCEVWFKYGDDNPNDLDESTDHQIMSAPGDFFEASGTLNPDTTYWVRAAANNGVCEAEGGTWQFKTQE